MIQCIIFKFRKWHACNYEWYRLYRSYENCRRPGVAILDIQMSKVPIISGNDLLRPKMTISIFNLLKICLLRQLILRHLWCACGNAVTHSFLSVNSNGRRQKSSVRPPESSKLRPISQKVESTQFFPICMIISSLRW